MIEVQEAVTFLKSQKGVNANLIFADPPFNIGRTGYDAVVNDKQTDQEYRRWTWQWINAAEEALSGNGSLVVNCFDNIAAYVVEHFYRAGTLSLRRWIIWHYRFGQNVDGNFIQSHQHVLYFTRPGVTPVFYGSRILEPSDRASKYGDSRTWNKKNSKRAGMRLPFDVWYGAGFNRVQGNNRERWKSKQHPKGHDNQLPIAYMVRVIRALSKKGDLVLDPFVGSGTTPLVASVLGREFRGCDIAKNTAVSARKRVKDKTQRGLVRSVVRAMREQ